MHHFSKAIRTYGLLIYTIRFIYVLLENLHPTPPCATSWLSPVSRSMFSNGWIDGFGSLLSRCWLNSKHNEPFKGSTRLQIFFKRIRTDLSFSYQNSHIKSVGSMNVKFMSKVILVLAHRLHWDYILNPKVLLLHSSWLNEFWLMQGCIID